MASGKQQNLLIPLIVFVVLTVIASVTAVVFYQKATKLDTELANQRKTAEDANQKKAAVERNITTLKNLIGYPEAEFGTETDVAGGTTLVSKIREDLAKYVEPGTPPSFSYRVELERLAQRKDDLAKELDAKTVAFNRLREDFDATRKAEEGKINENIANYVEANADREKMQREVQQIKDESTRQIQEREMIAQKNAEDKKQVENEYENFRKRSDIERGKLVAQVTQFKDSVQRIQSSGTPVGSVISVDNLNDEVYIDRGSDDLLPMHTTFSIWSPDQQGTMHWREKNEKVKADASKEFDESGRRNLLEPRLEGGPKAYIEIVAILGPNQAKGRITMEKYLDPITPGDLLFTPLWAPGQRKHFALAGRFDMTGKGTNDRALLIDLIKRQGGVIDAEVRDDGTLEGGIEVGTHYLVIGDLGEEGDGTATDQQKEHATRIRTTADELRKEAKSLGIEVIDQHKLYDFMGYKQFSRKYELGGFTGGPEPQNRFENPSQSTRPSGLPTYSNPNATTRPQGIPGRRSN